MPLRYILGPRFVLNPIRFFEGSFGGPTLYENASYVAPNEVGKQALTIRKTTQHQFFLLTCYCHVFWMYNNLHYKEYIP